MDSHTTMSKRIGDGNQRERGKVNVHIMVSELLGTGRKPGEMSEHKGKRD